MAFALGQEREFFVNLKILLADLRVKSGGDNAEPELKGALDRLLQLCDVGAAEPPEAPPTPAPVGGARQVSPFSTGRG